jgi:hypothetical protein
LPGFENSQKKWFASLQLVQVCAAVPLILKQLSSSLPATNAKALLLRRMVLAALLTVTVEAADDVI